MAKGLVRCRRGLAAEREVRNARNRDPVDRCVPARCDQLDQLILPSRISHRIADRDGDQAPSPVLRCQECLSRREDCRGVPPPARPYPGGTALCNSLVHRIHEKEPEPRGGVVERTVIDRLQDRLPMFPWPDDAPSGPAQVGARRERGNRGEAGFRPRGHHSRCGCPDGDEIEIASDTGMGEDSTDRRCDDQAVAQRGVIQWTLPEEIPGTEGPSLPAIPEQEGEFTFEVRGAVLLPGPVGRRNEMAGGGAGRFNARRSQPPAQIIPIDEETIGGDDQVGFNQQHDGAAELIAQLPLVSRDRECYAVFIPDFSPFAPAPAHPTQHAADGSVEDLAVVITKNPKKSAHGSVRSPPARDFRLRIIQPPAGSSIARGSIRRMITNCQ